MRIGTLLVSSAIGLGASTGAWGQTLNYLGSPTSSWVPYAGGALPTLNTAAPGSVTGGTNYTYARSTAPVPAPATWRTGDLWTMQFNGTVGNGTIWRVEFSDNGHAAGLQMYVNNGKVAGADFVQASALGTAPTTLWSGDFGGPAGVGSAEPVTVNLTFKLLSGTQASVSGLVSDVTGTRWSGPAVTIPLGLAGSAIYPAFNTSITGTVTGINSLNWAYTPVPEPGTLALLTGGLVGLCLWRRRSV